MKSSSLPFMNWLLLTMQWIHSLFPLPEGFPLLQQRFYINNFFLSVAERIRSTELSNDIIWIQTHKIPAHKHSTSANYATAYSFVMKLYNSNNCPFWIFLNKKYTIKASKHHFYYIVIPILLCTILVPIMVISNDILAFSNATCCKGNIPVLN
jgi:hypothetical protein